MAQPRPDYSHQVIKKKTKVGRDRQQSNHAVEVEQRNSGTHRLWSRRRYYHRGHPMAAKAATSTADMFSRRVTANPHWNDQTPHAFSCAEKRRGARFTTAKAISSDSHEVEAEGRSSTMSARGSISPARSWGVHDRLYAATILDVRDVPKMKRRSSIQRLPGGGLRTSLAEAVAPSGRPLSMRSTLIPNTAS